MNTRTAACTALLALAALAVGCGGNEDKPSKPATSTPPSPSATVDPAAARQACVDAVAAIPAGDNGEVPSEPIPDECKTLSNSEYIDAYMDGIEQGNQEARDAMQDLIDEASANAQP